MLKFAKISSLAFAAVLAGTAAEAQETHTITPHYPDSFKIELTSTNDSEHIGQDSDVKSHTRMVVTESVQKTDTGYKAVITPVSTDADSRDGDGKPSAQAEMQKHILGTITSVGPVEVTLDKDMTPLSVDNIEAIKPRLKAALTGSGDPRIDAAGMQLYDAFVSGLTPQSAALFLKQVHQTSAESVYNRPLPLHTPVALPGAPTQFMGATLHMTGTITLDEWHDGQSATVTTVLAPTESDLHVFMSAFVNNMVAKFMTGDNAKYKPVIDRIMDNMRLTMTVTCHATTDLTNFAVTRTDCDSTSAFAIDLAKALPPEMLKEQPQLAHTPPVSLSQISHSVTEGRLIP